MKRLLRDLHDRVYVRFGVPRDRRDADSFHATRKIHYGCGHAIFKNWINVDIRPIASVPKVSRAHYYKMNVTQRHPFPNLWFDFGYSEDFIEHIEQADAIVFLSEIYRTFAPGGVLRLSTPGLEGVLRKHYRSSDYQGARTGKLEAYDPYGHRHFFSQQSLATVAAHIGFSKIEFKAFSDSEHEELRGLETRSAQIDLNIIAELTK
jgi:predicted SAM-dependent methyltransferase